MMRSMTYYDPIDGRRYVKRRYLWGLWCFFGGSAFGMLLAVIIR